MALLYEGMNKELMYLLVLFYGCFGGVCSRARVQSLVIAACLCGCFVCLCFDSVDDSCIS